LKPGICGASLRCRDDHKWAICRSIPRKCKRGVFGRKHCRLFEHPGIATLAHQPVVCILGGTVCLSNHGRFWGNMSFIIFCNSVWWHKWHTSAFPKAKTLNILDIVFSSILGESVCFPWHSGLS